MIENAEKTIKEYFNQYEYKIDDDSDDDSEDDIEEVLHYKSIREYNDERFKKS